MHFGIAIIAAALTWSASDSVARPAPSRVATLLTVRMASPTSGWAAGATGLLRTTDGGVHWQVVTPPALGRPLRRSPTGLVTAFLDETHAWVAVDNSVVSAVSGQSKPPTTLRLFRTADQGRHWYALPLLRLGVFDYAGTLSFVSRDIGWLEIIRNVGAGSVWFDLYRSPDGGVHCQRVLQVGSPHPSSGTPLGCDLCDGGITFTGQTTGWFTGCWCGIGTGSSFLYVSRNAGRTWRAMALSLPPHRGRITTGTLPPTMFDQRNGILPAVVFGLRSGRSRGGTAFFDASVTHDGGRHWMPAARVPTIPLAGYPGLPYSFPDSRHGFVLTGKRLYRTSDGGRHWQATSVRIPLDGVATLPSSSSTDATDWPSDPASPLNRAQSCGERQMGVKPGRLSLRRLKASRYLSNQRRDYALESLSGDANTRAQPTDMCHSRNARIREKQERK